MVRALLIKAACVVVLSLEICTAFAQETETVQSDAVPDEGRAPGDGVFADPNVQAVDWSDTPADPVRVWFQFGGGFTLRLIQDRNFAQDAFAPAYFDAFGAVILPSSEVWRHGVGLGASFNLVGDGGILEGVGAFQQFVFTPSYLAYLRFSDDVVAHGKLGVPWAVSPETSLGLQLDLGVTGLLTSSLGAYAEVGLAAFLGAESTIHPTLSAEVGLSIDYEVLP